MTEPQNQDQATPHIAERIEALRLAVGWGAGAHAAPAEVAKAAVVFYAFLVPADA